MHTTNLDSDSNRSNLFVKNFNRKSLVELLLNTIGKCVPKKLTNEPERKKRIFHWRDISLILKFHLFGMCAHMNTEQKGKLLCWFNWRVFSKAWYESFKHVQFGFSIQLKINIIENIHACRKIVLPLFGVFFHVISVIGVSQRY